MIVTVASFKGGVGKSTTAIHLAAFLQKDKPTILLDGDKNRTALAWNARGPGLPFAVCDELQAVRHVREYQHCVIDTAAGSEDLETLVGGCDLLIIPSTPDALSIPVMTTMVDTLRGLNAKHYRVLLTIVPPPPENDGDEARADLEEAGISLFNGSIRRYKAFGKAGLLGVPVYDVKRDKYANAAWSDYDAIGKEILNG
jgi:chromosome partitioning protein